VWHPDPDRLALAALPAEPPDPAVEAHLVECALCRGHVESLRRTVDLAVAGAADGTEYGDPPDRVWAAITDEIDLVPAVVPLPGARHARPPSRWRRLALPVAASVVALAAGIGIGAALSGGPPEPRSVAALGPVDPAAPSGSGTAGIADDGGLRVVVVEVQDAALPPDADYLEAWLMDPTGTRLVSLGALAEDGSGFRGEFGVPADLPAGEFSVVDVSAERWDGDEQHSRISLLRGTLA
jgi:hypothetical protein